MNDLLASFRRLSGGQKAIALGVPVVLIILAVSSIDGAGDSEDPPAAAGPDCSAVSRSTLNAIEDGLIHSDTSLSRGAALRDGSWWYVAAEIEGGVMDGPGDIGVWAMPDKDDPGPIIMAEAFAREFSQWGTQTGAENAGVWMGAALDAQDCLGQ